LVIGQRRTACAKQRQFEKEGDLMSLFAGVIDLQQACQPSILHVE